MKIENIDQHELKSLIGLELKPIEIMNLLLKNGINLLPMDCDFERLHCSPYLANESIAVWDIAKCSNFFIFESKEQKISGRVIECKI